MGETTQPILKAKINDSNKIVIALEGGKDTVTLHSIQLIPLEDQADVNLEKGPSLRSQTTWKHISTVSAGPQLINLKGSTEFE